MGIPIKKCPKCRTNEWVPAFPPDWMHTCKECGHQIPAKGPLGIRKGECWISTPGGGHIAFQSAKTNPKGTTFVRLVDVVGKEVAYWDSLEWKEDPVGVMGAVMGAVGGWLGYPCKPVRK